MKVEIDRAASLPGDRAAFFSATDPTAFDQVLPEPWQVTLVLGRDQAHPCQVELESEPQPRLPNPVESESLEAESQEARRAAAGEE